VQHRAIQRLLGLGGVGRYARSMSRVRERLNAYFRKHEQADARSERLIQVAVEQLGLTLDFLDFAIEDYEAANAKYRAEHEQFMEDVRFNESGGETKRTHSANDVEERRPR
jgi:hypothetical protein